MARIAIYGPFFVLDESVMKKTVVVGMSGGVDSSVAAYLLKEQGYRVIGLFMKNWEELAESGSCQAAQDYDDVVQVCDRLDIPHYAVNFSDDYLKNVFEEFLSDYSQGYTPNPDILCNREIKFKIFLNKAIELGADFLATGHYCRTLPYHGQACLAKGLDSTKDQSYFLYTLQSEQLQKVLFPLGGLEKALVKKIAEEQGFITAAKKESMGICFIGKRDFKSFLSQYLKSDPGTFETLDGKVIGKNDGAIYYTIGQRKGLGIGGPGEAWFVVAKDMKRNVVKVVQGENHPALYSQSLRANELSWCASAPQNLPFRCEAKIRYRQASSPCIIEKIEGDYVFVTFDSPQKAVTPRQSIVFYDGEICMGGGMIATDCGRVIPFKK